MESSYSHAKHGGRDRLVVVDSERAQIPRQGIKRLLRDFDYGSHRGAAARAAVRAIGTNSLPTLIRYLEHRDSLFKLRFIAFVQQLDIWKARVDDDFLWHRRAALACGELGLAAEPALPVLAQAATNSQAPEQVVEALSRMLPKSTAVLTNVVVTCRSGLARDRAMVLLADACSYPEVAAMSIVGLSNALHSFVTGSGAIVALARVRDGNCAPETREAAARALKSFQPIPQYPEWVNALLSSGTNQTPSQVGLRSVYGP